MNQRRKSADPEGGAHGCATFFYEAGCRLEKSLRQRIARLALYGEAFFFASVSLTRAIHGARPFGASFAVRARSCARSDAYQKK
jgi:hypothetical protein